MQVILSQTACMVLAGHGRCEVGPKNWWEVMVLKIGRRREVDLKKCAGGGRWEFDRFVFLKLRAQKGQS